MTWAHARNRQAGLLPALKQEVPHSVHISVKLAAENCRLHTGWVRKVKIGAQPRFIPLYIPENQIMAFTPLSHNFFFFNQCQKCSSTNQDLRIDLGRSSSPTRTRSPHFYQSLSVQRDTRSSSINKWHNNCERCRTKRTLGRETRCANLRLRSLKVGFNYG